MKTGEIIQLTIEDMTREGMGIGHYDSIAVFVDGAAPGDILKCKITKFKKSYALAKLIKIIKPSENRISSACAFFPTCGGCSFWHIDYQAELKIKERWVKDALKRIGKLDTVVLPIIGSPASENYRNKSQFPIGTDKEGKVIGGFYKRASHDITDINDCNISSEKANKALAVFKRFINTHDISLYDPATKRGLVRHIYIRSSNKSGQVLVTIVINGEGFPYHDELAEAFKNSIDGFCGLLLNINRSDTNLVLGQEFVALWGKDHIDDEMLGVKFHISPLSFYQINSQQAENIYSLVEEYAALSKADILLDLYCGIGTMALILAKKAGRVIGVEILPEAVEDAILCAKENGIDNAEFICASASKAAELLREKDIAPSVIIVDPPRKGLDSETLEAIINLSPQKLIYVSCDPATLARDLKTLSENGYTLLNCQPFDMFPRTPHVETVVLMSRVK